MIRSSALLSLTVLVLVIPIPLEAAPTQTVLFEVGAVNVNDRWAYFIDPILLLDRGRILQPPSTLTRNEPAASYQRFARTYYRKGHTYTLLYGGSMRGTVSVQRGIELSCVSQAAAVDVRSPVRITAYEQGLATNDPRLGDHASSSRRPANPEERAAATRLARQALQEKRVPAAWLRRLVLRELTATDLHKDGSLELAGSVVANAFSRADYADIDQKGAYVFLIARQKAGVYQADLTLVHVAPNKKARIEEQFIDQVDLDRDGTDEIVTRRLYYETWDFAIYSRHNGRWVKFYEGGGGGC